jgi:hypothetical protein
MCNVLMPLGVNPIAVNKHIISNPLKYIINDTEIDYKTKYVHSDVCIGK